MQHQIPLDTLPPQAPAMAHAVERCVHCGFCLSACPTYQVLGEEMDSPRGRIILMKENLEGTLDLDATAPYLDRCLGCMACVTACPSGVEYGELLTPFRAINETRRERDPMSRLTRLLVRETLPYPRRFRLAAATGKLAKPFARFLPEALQNMLAMLPDELPPSQPTPEIFPAVGQRRARVALLTGCVQQVLAPDINAATLRVLARNGVEVVMPRGQGCCGSLSMHTGMGEQARSLARRNLDAFDGLFTGEYDALVTNAAGCGSGMKEYELWFKGEPEEARARDFAAQVVDISEFLAALGLVEPPALAEPLALAYHDACHLAHAQRITDAPRLLLSAIPGVELREIPDAELCCGSAGTYNLEQPELAHEIGERKARNILTTGASAIATGNIGCMTQIQNHLAHLGQPLPVWHTVQVLDRAYRGQRF